LAFPLALCAAFVCQARGIAQVSGDQKTLVILTDFNDQSLSCSPDFVRALMFDPTESVAALYKNN
jgi:hypothetical protein